MARVLSDTGNVISFDLPGFGASPHPTGQVSVEDHARLVARALDDRNVGPVVAVGHSMGAQFAIELAVLRPDLVSHVVLVGPVVDPARRTLRAQARALMRDWPLEPPQTQAMVVGDYLRCGFRWFLAQSIVMRDYPAHVRVLGVTQPMLVIRGAHDPIAKPAWVDWLAEQVRDGRVETIDGYRHNVAHSNAAATAVAILRFTAGSPR
jgi:pimeloyl-ACP methyl ester carboxylesterase